MATGFGHIEVGDSFSDSVTITDSRVLKAAELFDDFAPVHVDEAFARTTHFGTRVAHGTLLTGIMAGLLSRHFGTNALGYLEESMRFRAPVFVGDTVTTTWTIAEKTPKKRFGGGIVSLSVVCMTQAGIVAVEGRATMIVGAL